MSPATGGHQFSFGTEREAGNPTISKWFNTAAFVAPESTDNGGFRGPPCWLPLLRISNGADYSGSGRVEHQYGAGPKL